MYTGNYDSWKLDNGEVEELECNHCYEMFKFEELEEYDDEYYCEDCIDKKEIRE